MELVNDEEGGMFCTEEMLHEMIKQAEIE